MLLTLAFYPPHGAPLTNSVAELKGRAAVARAALTQPLVPRMVDGERVDSPKEAIERLSTVDSASASACACASASASASASAIGGRAVIQSVCGRRERLELVEHTHGVVGPDLDGDAGGVRWPATIDGAACSVERVE